MDKVWTLLDVLRWTSDHFQRQGIDSPRRDAELLIGSALGLDRVGVYVNFDRPLEAGELTRIRTLVARRARREPLQYILGETEFWSLPFRVCPAVLIPRPDTEILVEEALKRAAPEAAILDLGTGSGALAVVLAHELPKASVTACDLSPEALAVAADNARRNGVGERLQLLEQDFGKPCSGEFDLILSNPPYITTGEMEDLMPEVRDHEPHLALAGGEDGLDAIRAILSVAPAALRPGGWLLLEVGQGQADRVEALLAAAGLSETFQRRDYADIPRVVGGKKA
jgi:release factor glutamine methyltransferase